MFKDFSQFNFEVIDITARGNLEMVINKNGVFFSSQVLDNLGSPDFVKPLLDMKNKAFAVQACKNETECTMKFSNPKSKSNGSYTSTCTAIRKTLRRLMENWKDNARYKIPGVFFQEYKAVVFDLTKAIELSPAASRHKKVLK